VQPKIKMRPKRSNAVYEAIEVVISENQKSRAYLPGLSILTGYLFDTCHACQEFIAVVSPLGVFFGQPE